MEEVGWAEEKERLKMSQSAEGKQNHLNGLFGV